MNVNQLHRALGKLIEAGHGRKPMAVNVRTFHTYDPNDVNILPVEQIAGPQFICKADDDGGTSYNKDGSESGTFMVILRGGDGQ